MSFNIIKCTMYYIILYSYINIGSRYLLYSFKCFISLLQGLQNKSNVLFLYCKYYKVNINETNAKHALPWGHPKIFISQNFKIQINNFNAKRRVP